MSKKLIERWWKDIDKLESVKRYLQDLRRDVLSNSFAEDNSAVSTFQTLLNNGRRIRSGRLAVARAVKRLQEVADHERSISLQSLSVASEKVRDLGKRIAAVVFDTSKLPPPISALRFVPGLVAAKKSVTFVDDKKHYLSIVGECPDTGLAESIGVSVRQLLLAWTFSKRVSEAGLKPVNSPALRDNYQASRADMQEYISAVSVHCSALWAIGDEPVILVGHSAAGDYLRSYKWGPAHWQCPLPPDISFRVGEEAPGHVFVNDVPVFEYDTPNGDCYVIPASLLKTLAVAGADAATALSITWNEVGYDRLKFTVSWNAEFQ